jgi:hypothetical protein
MIDGIVGSTPPAAGIRQEDVGRADGVPLFAGEMIRVSRG